MKNKHTGRGNNITGSIRRLFGVHQKTINYNKRYPKEYFDNYYFPKNLCEGIEFIAAAERTSKRATAIMLIERGVRDYMRDKKREGMRIEDDRAACKKVRRTCFIMQMRKGADDHGFDISKVRLLMSTILSTSWDYWAGRLLI